MDLHGSQTHDLSTDPYVVRRQLLHSLNKQIIDENANRQDLLAVQESFERFEAHVIKTIQQAMASFVQVLGDQAERTKQLYGQMVITAERIPPNFEWRGFLHRNNHVLLDPDAPPRSMENVRFPNQDHPSTQPLIGGILQRKSRLSMKGYGTGYYVVTKSKYLHEYKDNDNYRDEPNPELSLYLPDCTVGVVQGLRFTVKGKNLAKGKIGSALSTRHELEFKANSNEEAEKWSQVIRSMATSDSSVPEPSPTSSSPPTPVTQEHRQHPPAYEDQQDYSHPQGHVPQVVPPVQTKGLKQSGDGGEGRTGAVTTSTSAPFTAEPKTEGAAGSVPVYTPTTTHAPVIDQSLPASDLPDRQK